MKHEKTSYGNKKITRKDEYKYAKSCLSKSEKIYCWTDDNGKTHFSNLGFPSSGEFTPKWIRDY